MNVKSIKCPECGSNNKTAITPNTYVCKNCFSKYTLSEYDQTIYHKHVYEESHSRFIFRNKWGFTIIGLTFIGIVAILFLLFTEKHADEPRFITPIIVEQPPANAWPKPNQQNTYAKVPRPTKEQCIFPEFVLSQDFLLYAGGAYSGKKFNFAMDDSGHAATQIDVYINETTKPVALILGAYEPTIWQIHASVDTKIIAVYLSGYYDQFLSGLPSSIPIIKSRDEANCLDISYVSTDEVAQINKIAAKSFKKSSIDMLYVGKDGILKIDNNAIPIDTNNFRQNQPITPETFRLKDTPLVGREGLEEAVEQGILRYATPQDFEKLKIKYDITRHHTAYVIQKRFRIPSGLYGAHSVIFILDKNVPQPKGDLGHSAIYDMNTGGCRGVSCYNGS